VRPRNGDQSTEEHLLFDGDLDHDVEDGARPRAVPRIDRSRRRHRRNLRFFLLLTATIVVVIAAVAVPWALNHFRVADYSGSGSGSVTVRVQDGDTAATIGTTLYRAGVVASVEAFTNAAENNSRSTDVQPGTYVLHRHMSGRSALAMLLSPSSRSAGADVVVPEGATVLDVESSLAKVLGAGDRHAIEAALKDPGDLGLPLGYSSGAHRPISPEGFLFPATYSIDPGSSAGDALQAMVARFAAEDRSLGFASAAAQRGLSPYRALIIASIAQAEAKFPADLPKVARVILNRLHEQRPLQIDATSAYRAKLSGLDPTSVIYSQVQGPYNTYRHLGLPPTPIDNPGAAALRAAVHPASGNWLYYVNSDAAGHLFFTADEQAFAKAAARCRAQHWGCG
jgi:UPF0755 protein